MSKNNIFQNITKWNKRFVTKKNLLPDVNGVIPSSVQDNEEIQQNIQLLASCQAMYSALSDFREDREINRKYFFGDQFCEKIPDPDFPGAFITEKEYIIRQGMTPLTLNIIHVACKALSGLYTAEKMEPLVKSRIREEQKIGELITMCMQYAFQQKNIYQTALNGYKEFQISAIPSFRVFWEYDDERKKNNVGVQLCDDNRMFWDTNVGTSDEYFRKVTTIGYLHDMYIDEVLAEFAKTSEDNIRIRHAYSDKNDPYPIQYQQELSKNKDQSMSFFTTNEPYKCRVIEVWRREAHEVYSCHDTAAGELYTLPYTQESLREIAMENERRVAEVIAAGGDPSQASLIEYSFRMDRDWVCRYLTPNGLLLRKEISPYLHGSHPFVIGAFPLVDGRVRSVVGDLRNAQRMINRTFTRSEFAAMNAWKGFKWINQDILDRSELTLEDFRTAYTSSNGIVGLRIKEGEENRIMGPADKTHMQNVTEDMRKIEFYMNIADKVSGTPGAVRGERPVSGTPSSLYAQETANANNNIADYVTWYNGLTERLYYKIMMLILQYYDEDRYLKIAGPDFMKEIQYILNSPKRDILCDVALIKSPSTGIARAQTEDMLLNMYQKGDIGPDIYLESTSTYGADKVLEKLKAQQQRMAEAQTQQMNAAAADPNAATM